MYATDPQRHRDDDGIKGVETPERGSNHPLKWVVLIRL